MADSSSLVFLVVILSIWSFMQVVVAAPKNTRVGEEDGLQEIEMQLKSINKPAIKSFITDHGDIFDCVKIYKQLAFDHPLLKNHTIQVIPKVVSSRKDNVPSRFECPQGTVIIKRCTKQDLINAKKLKYASGKSQNGNGHHSAGLQYEGAVTEASGFINVWSPDVSPRQYSQARILVSSQGNSIQAGWQVDPARNTYLRFYTYWTADGFKEKGCFDMHCPGFVQVSKTNPLGTLLGEISTRDHRQTYIDVIISREPNTGNWWLFYEDEEIGYWPRELFTEQGLAKEASYASWGGEVFSPIGEKSPPMGSGSFAQEGYRFAAHISAIMIRDALWGRKIPVGLTTYSDQPSCYNALRYTPPPGDEPEWDSAVFYGGPGGC